MKKTVIRAASLLLALVLTLTAAVPVSAAEAQTKDVKLAVISDDHLYSQELGVTGSAFEAYLAADRKMLQESEAILDAALDEIAGSGVDYLLITGDLTKDGEKVNHELLASKLAELEKDTGIQVFVINGNHDISNAHAVSFSGSETTPVDTITTTDFRSIYAQFGYDEAVAKDENSLSYAVNLGDDYRLIVMDSGIYNNDAENPEQQTAGRLTESTLNWVLGQIQDAIRDGRRPIGMMHHGLVPHTAIQPSMFSEYLVENYEAVAATLADAGMNLVFTGHFHSQDTAMTTTEKGSVLYDVETGSLVTSPCPIRYVTLSGDTFSFTTNHITKVPELPDVEDFPTYANGFLVSGMEGLLGASIPAILKQLKPDLTNEQAVAAGTALANTDLGGGITVKGLLAGAFVAHYAGGENLMADPQAAAILAGLMENEALHTCLTNLGLPEEACQQVATLIYQMAGALYTDSEGPDLEADGLTLTALPEVDQGTQGGGSTSGGSSTGGSTSGGSSTGTTTGTPDTEAPAFTDVASTAWYAEAVDYAVEKGLMNGVSETEFAPGSATTRAMIVTILYRLAGSPAVDSDSTAWYAGAQAWAMAQGVTDGANLGAAITREQLAAMLYRYAGSPAVSGDLSAWTDGSAVSAWASDAMVWAVEEGILTGKPGNCLDPDAGATRAEAAAMLLRFSQAL